MGSFSFSSAPTDDDVRPVDLSADERDFLQFLLYQHGHAYLDGADDPDATEA